MTCLTPFLLVSCCTNIAGCGNAYHGPDLCDHDWLGTLRNNDSGRIAECPSSVDTGNACITT